MLTTWNFPFGQPVSKIVQTDRSPKRIFVLGVYASAVHACWLGIDNKPKVNALAVASEPYIFWRGDNAESIIRQINIPKELGQLTPANQQFNGPSGRTLDECILKPLSLSRTDVWLCDLIPYSCSNPAQRNAIRRSYLPLTISHGLPHSTVPPVPYILTDDMRRREILDELRESTASTIILLGDMPIKWFLRYFDDRWTKLADFGTENKTYGNLHTTRVGCKEITILPLAHPRQIARLGRSSAMWHDLHQGWIETRANGILCS